ncbi:BTB/POZ domain-containing protein 8-like isoform X2 [Oscarella lobularis]|uniref:BTB/POZ domain-containing protein 8-like isoform X2 n=1 Tax=Oscarella lobularis TaxID=121494 RepID=UPI003313BACE
MLRSRIREECFLKETERQKADLLRLFESGDFSDLTVVASGRRFPIHSTIVKARLGPAFAHSSSPLSNVLTLRDVDAADVEQTLRSIYSSDSIFNESVLNELARVSLSEAEFDKLLRPIKVIGTLQECLSHLFETKDFSDISLHVEKDKIQAHRVVLACRCAYFGAMLGGSWTESLSKEITLKGVVYSCVESALRFMYCCRVDWSSHGKITDLLVMADMYGLVGMKEGLCVYITQVYCCHFHKPCKNCTEKVPQCLRLAEDFQIGELKKRCVSWLGCHYDRVWCTRAFASLSADLHSLVLSAKTTSLTCKNVISVMRGCDRLTGAMSSSCKWAEPVLELNQKLMNSCVRFVSCNIHHIIQSTAFYDLFQGIGSSHGLVSLIFEQLLVDLSEENSCLILRYSSELLSSSFADDIQTLVIDFHQTCKKFVLSHLARIRPSARWETLPKQLRDDLETDLAAAFVDFRDGNKSKRQVAINSKKK